MTGKARRHSHVHLNSHTPIGHGHAVVQVKRPKPLPPHVVAFLAAYAAQAKVVALKYDLKTSEVLAQSALESDWGRKAPGDAFFGIKSKASSPNSVTFATHETIKGKSHAETDAFRAYDSWADSADDYGNLISTDKRYATVYANRHDPIKYAKSMGSSPYATGEGYGKLMSNIIQSLHLTDYDK